MIIKYSKSNDQALNAMRFDKSNSNLVILEKNYKRWRNFPEEIVSDYDN